MASVDLLGGAVELLFESKGKLVSIGSLLNISSNVTFIERVKVKIGLGLINQIEVTLNPPIDQAFALIRTGVLGLGFSPRKSTSKSSTSVTQQQANTTNYNIFMNKIQVRLNYGGLRSPWFRGMLLQPDIEIGPEGVSINLKAIGMLFSSSSYRQQVNFSASTTMQSAVSQLLGDTENVFLNFTPGATGVLNRPIQSSFGNQGLSSSGESHFETAKKILQANDCKMVTEGLVTKKIGTTSRTLESIRIFHVKDSRSRHVAEFVAYRQINPTGNPPQYPLISFSAPIQNILFKEFVGSFVGLKSKDAKQASTKVGSVRGDKKQFANVDSATSYPLRGEVPTTPDKSVAGDVAPGQQSQVGDTGGLGQSDLAKGLIHITESSKDVLLGYLHDFADKVFEYDATSIGVVNLLPGNLVQIAVSDIKELTASFDLIDVEHEATSTGIETKMNMIRTGGIVSSVFRLVETVKNTAFNAVGNKKSSTKVPATP